MSDALAACGGFLLAVLWFDLMFDVQTLRYGLADPLPEPILASIANYYRRVTIEAFPMNRAVSAVMVFAIAGSTWQLWSGGIPRWRAAFALALVLSPVSLAAARVVPCAVRLGKRADSVAVQSRLARAICRDHFLCFAAIAGFLSLQLLPG